MLNRKNSIVFLLVIIILFELLVAYIGDIRDREAWGDEVRIHATAVEFSQNLSWEMLRDYPQMSTPLPFILYGYWGKLFGTDLFSMRILSILIALFTYLLFFRILLQETDNLKFSLLGTIFLMIHPYMVGLSIFVFTDMPAIFFLLLSYYFLKKENFPLYMFAAALSILCRQYILFYTAAVGCYFLMTLLLKKDRSSIKKIFYTIGSVIPYFLLIVYWGGTSPDNIYREMYLTDGFTFRLYIFHLYAAQLFLYMLPYYFVTYRYFLNKTVFLFAIACSGLYYFSPIQPAKYSVDIGVYTVGLFHKGLLYIFTSDMVVQIILYVCVVAGLQVLFVLVNNMRLNIKDKQFTPILTVDFIILFFFIVMPFSYLGWEKYFVPLLPFLILRFSLFCLKPISR